uniref:Uncharacterized protein n=1 Tax=Mustela putorius furo TaxID=9669 RepID=M3Z1Q6_MUSPF
MGWALLLTCKASFRLDRGIRGVLLGRALQVLPPELKDAPGEGLQEGWAPQVLRPSPLASPGLPEAPTRRGGICEPGVLTSRNTGNIVPAAACPEARHAPGNGIQPGVGDPPPAPLHLPLSFRDAFVSLGPRKHESTWFHPSRLCRGPWSGGPLPGSGSSASSSPPRPSLPFPGRPGLPLGRWQMVAQPAWQHLRLSAHWASERHSCVQFRSACSWGHTPGFSASPPGRRTVSGRGAPVSEGAHLLRPGLQISSSKGFSVSGPRRPS